jgi:transposase
VAAASVISAASPMRAVGVSHVVAIDPYEAYRQALQAELAGTRIVVDPLHLVARRRPGARHGARGAPAGSEAAQDERPPLAAGEPPRAHLPPAPPAAEGQRAAHRARAAQALRAVRAAPERRGLGLKEGFRSIYKATERLEAERRLDAFLAAVERAALPAFEAFANGLRPRRAELLADFDEQVTNGYAEGVTNKVKVIKRRAYGMPSFESFRRRVLLACA